MRGALWLALLFFALGFALLAALVHGQAETVAIERDPAVLLARSCVSERGWRVHTDDCAAIADVVRARMLRLGGTFAENIRAIANHVHGAAVLPHRAWLQHLERDHTRRRPVGMRARWVNPEDCTPEDPRSTCRRLERRPLWAATLAEADAIMVWHEAHPLAELLVCAEAPSTWGSSLDIAAHLRAHPEHRWRAVDCGDTANGFGGYYERGSR